ncbi:MAG: ABC transporter permease [Corynebacterium sp.]|nr:ABC transporter permease [Corynebacterium sp.]
MKTHVRVFSFYAGLFGLGFMVLLAFIGLVWTPYDPLAVDPINRLAGSSWEHLFGTDRYGRDVFSQILAGAHRSLGVGMAATLVAAGIGIPLGLIAAWYPDWRAHIIMRACDILVALPALLLAIVATAIWGSSTVVAVIAIGIANIAIFTRITRVAATKVLVEDFVLASRDAGHARWWISQVHILPNIRSLLAAQAAITCALAMLAEAGLSFLGLGTPPPEPSWGRMLYSAQSSLASAPHLALWPGLFLALSILACYFLSDGLRSDGLRTRDQSTAGY